MVPRLHLITPDRADGPTLALTADLLAAGAPLVQVRLKQAGDGTCVTAVRAALATRRDPSQLVLVDDRVDVVLAAGADGVHVGDDDLPVEDARHLLPGRLVGATARDADTARRAEDHGADYLGVGPVYVSTTKTTGLPDPIGLEGLAAVAAAVTIPVIAIAGVGLGHVAEVLGTGAHGLAVCGAVYDRDEPVGALEALLRAIDTHVGADAGARR